MIIQNFDCMHFRIDNVMQHAYSTTNFIHYALNIITARVSVAIAQHANRICSTSYYVHLCLGWPYYSFRVCVTSSTTPRKKKLYVTCNFLFNFYSWRTNSQRHQHKRILSSREIFGQFFTNFNFLDRF